MPGSVKFNPDVCRQRHGGNPQSEEANDRIQPHKEMDRQKVLAAVVASGDVGVTCKELAAAWGVGQNNISGRFTELKDDFYIRQSKTTPKRDHATVWVATGRAAR